MWKTVALVACCAVTATPFARADEGQPSTEAAMPAPCDRPVALARSAWAKDRWRDGPDPELATRARQALGCTPGRARAKRAISRIRRDFWEYRLYRTVAKEPCGFNTGAPRGPGDGEFYALDCAVVCGESGGHFYPPLNPLDGYGQWIASSWSRWVPGRAMERRLERRFHVRLEFGSRAGYSGALEQHIVGWLSSGNDTWYGWKDPSACR
jgi:hypothetical protein